MIVLGGSRHVNSCEIANNNLSHLHMLTVVKVVTFYTLLRMSAL